MTNDTESLNITSALGLEPTNTVAPIIFQGEVGVEPLEAVGIIEEALIEVQNNLADFADSAIFETDMFSVFGESANVDLGETIIDALANGEDLPQIIVVSAEQMNGAVGGFDSQNGQIYLADSLINYDSVVESETNSVIASETLPVIGTESSPVVWSETLPVVASETQQTESLLVDVITEEIGHYIDFEINDSDVSGDEGEYFTALVNEYSLSDAEIERLGSENDEVWIFDGAVLVEASSELTFETKTFPTGDEPLGMAAADFDKDGKQDIVVANNWESANSVSVFFGDGKGGALTAPTFTVGGKPVYVGVGDFNQDSNPDIATTNLENDTVAVLLGDGRGAFSTPTEFGVGDRPFGLVLADVNRDRKLDIITANTVSDDVSILLGNGDGSFAQSLTYQVGADTPGFPAVGNFNGDPFLDIVVTNYLSDNVSVLLGNGDGSFGFPTNFGAGGDEPNGIEAKDLNGDRKLDIVVATENSDNISVIFGTGDGRFGFPNNFSVGDNPEDVAIGDLNNDGKQDIVAVNKDSDNISVLPGQGKGNFGAAINFQVGDAPIDVVLEDFNNDGKLDIAVTNIDEDTISILTNTSEIATTEPNITISDTTITEGNRGKKNAKFTVNLDNASSETVKVNYTTANGTAKAGKDYKKTNGILTFKPGQTKKTINIPILGDTLDENNEKFNINLSKPKNAKLSDKRGIATIRDNDDTQPELSISDAQITENDKGRKQLKFDITLNTKVNKKVQVNYGTADGTAKEGSDYIETSGKLTFKPNQKKKTITVPIKGDTLNENDEKFTVTLSKPKNAKLGDKRGIGTIKDNDAGSDKPGDSFETAVNLGKITGEEIVSDKIGFSEAGDRDTDDFYSFRTDREGTLVLVLDDLLKNANIDLYDSEEVLIFQSKNDGADPESIVTRLDKGTYFVRVYPQGSARTSYRLSVDLL
ncbi:FG-GAP-like repeat-containing protein [Okeania sp.]|uniref:FG-GAP-like repeat-containing protein n=1 Tax=Okeania sp. TaxID=3100323 RepID=UPI002B4B167C|nr:FG-GAP-like repeat-containing protein [Okeania sp.]MEB3342970.1 FG-GAP-like repeat-containing protein [Okeania sp.]